MTQKGRAATFVLMVTCVIAMSGCASMRSGTHAQANPPSVATRGADMAGEDSQPDEYDP